MDERSVTADDFLYVLMWGQVRSVEKSTKTGHWKCKVNGVDIDGEELALLVAIDEAEQLVICVTVF